MPLPAGDSVVDAAAARASARDRPASASGTPRWNGRDRLVAVLVAFGLALIAVEAAFWVATVPDQPVAIGVQVLSLLLFLGVGSLAWHRRPHNDIGLLLVVTGFSMWLGGLVQAPLPALEALGTVTRTLPLATTLHTVLAFPSGRVRGRLARVLVGLTYLASTILEAPRYLVGEGPLALTDAPAVRALLGPAQVLQTTAGVTGMLGASALVALRAFRLGPGATWRVGPMVWYRILGPAVIGLAALARRVAPADPLHLGFYAQAGTIVLLPLVFAAGLLGGSFGRAGEVDEMVARMGARTPSPQQLDAAVASALGDPRASLVYALDGGGFVDAAGRPAGGRPDASPGSGWALYPVRYDGRVVGAVRHRTGSAVDDGQLEVLSGIVALALDHQRLAAAQQALVNELRGSEEQLRVSRHRLLRAEDEERRRIARDLHDGAQQRLVLLGMNARRLSLAAGDPDVRDAAASIADGVTDVLAEFRDLVAGIMPVPLVDSGLAPAVELLAQRMPIPTRVTGHAGARRPAAEVESTLYFLVSEALTNVVKHSAATRAEVTIEHVLDAAGRRALRVAVNDNGAGGADARAGTGLTGLADRVGALGGTLRVRSAPGAGSSIVAEVPCDC